MLDLLHFQASRLLDTLGRQCDYRAWKVCRMTTTERRRVAAGGVREAEDAVETLRQGLKGVGLTLPSLRIDPASCAGNEPAPLVDLGRCNIDTALRLSAVLDKKCDGEAGHDG